MFLVLVLAKDGSSRETFVYEDLWKADTET